jgi:tetratricopeptide (TPR) repeat protein
MEPAMSKDAQEYTVSGATAESIALHDNAVRALCLVYGDPLGQVEAALKISPDFAMAQLAKAWMLTLPNDPGLIGAAKKILSGAGTLTMNERERAHYAALDHAVAGSRRAAVSVLDRHLMSYPRDIVAHMAAAFLDVYLGRTQLERDRVGRALPFWSKDAPGYGILLALHGFGLEEAGDYARAEDESRVAVDLEPHNFFPHHTVTHVMEMTGRPEDGLGWMATREPCWAAPENGMRSHIWWHKSLFYLELGQFEDALAIYDGPILHTMRPIGTRLTDPVALLWRLDTLGCDVGNRWRDLLPVLEGHSDGKCLFFTDMHAAMAELRSGNEALVERRLEWMGATAASNAEAAPLYRDVGIPLVEGLMAFHKGAYGRAVDLLYGIRYDLWQIGGSIAQRDVVDWTLTEAAVRGGLRDVAVALSHERLANRPRSAINRRFQREAERIVS